MEFTDNSVGYEWELAGPMGAAFYLQPLRGKHSASDVVAAKRQLRREHDVVSMRTDWVGSYGGQLFATHRKYVQRLQEMKKQVCDNLSPEHLAAFKAMTISRQRYLVWQLMNSGAFSWSITPR